MLKKTLVAGLLGLAGFAANAGMFSTDGKDDDCPKKKSLAWCVFDLAGVRGEVDDTVIKKSDLAKAAANTPGGTAGFDAAILIADKFGGGLRVTELRGLSVLGLVGSFLKEPPWIMRHNMMIAMAPADIGADVNAARAVLIRTYLESIAKSYATKVDDLQVDTITGVQGYRVGIVWPPILRVVLTSSNCPGDKCIFGIGDRVRPFGGDGKLIDAPEWAGSGKVWLFQRDYHSPVKGAAVRLGCDTNGELDPCVDFTSRLPGWFYFSFPNMGEPFGAEGAKKPLIVLKGGKSYPMIRVVD
jgi:hypothetical protein